MAKWVSQSNRGQQIALSVGCMVVGLALAVGCRHFQGPGITNTMAGFLLGLLLLFLGLATIIVSGQQTVVIDPTARCITVEETSLLKKVRRSIPFGDIVDIHIGFVGKRSNYVTNYYLELVPKSTYLDRE